MTGRPSAAGGASGGIPRGEPADRRTPILDGIAAVIFDLDGVLVDSEIWWDEVRHAFAREHGRVWTVADREAVMGQNSRQWAATMRRRLGLELDERSIERAIVEGVVRRYAEEGPPRVEGAVETVRALEGRFRLGVASSAHREVIDAALDALQLHDSFPVVVSSDEVAHGKPEPDVYLEAAGRLDVEPAAALVIEDSRNGVLAARAAGMRVVLVPNVSIPPPPGTGELADVVLDRLSDLVA